MGTNSVPSQTAIVSTYLVECLNQTPNPNRLKYVNVVSFSNILKGNLGKSHEFLQKYNLGGIALISNCLGPLLWTRLCSHWKILF